MRKEDFNKIIEYIQSTIDAVEDESSKASLKEKLDEIKSKAPSEDEKTVDVGEELQSNMAEFFKIAATLPDLQKEAKNEQKIGKILNDFSGFVSGFSDLKLANDQINEARATLETIEPPQRLRTFQRSPLLAQQIRNAQQANTASGIGLRTSAAEDDISQNYIKDLNQAAISSAGQAGAYGSYSQAASRNRIRNAMQLQDLRQQLMDRNNRNLNYLATQQINENQAADVNARARAENDYRRFLDQSKAAGGLLQAGQINRRFSTNNLLSGLSSLAPYMVRAKSANESRIPIGQRFAMNRSIRRNEPLIDFNSPDFQLFEFKDRLNSSFMGDPYYSDNNNTRTYS